MSIGKGVGKSYVHTWVSCELLNGHYLSTWVSCGLLNGHYLGGM